MDDKAFEIGDAVEWWSSFATKRGKIVAVVPAGDVPADVGMKVDGAGSPRDHESYVVSARSPKPSGSGFGPSTDHAGPLRVYWPRVSALKASPPTPAAS